MRAGSPWVAFLCRRKGSGSGAAPPPTAPAPWSAESLRADRLLKEAGRRPSVAECEHSAERERERYQEDSALHLCPVPSSPSGLLSTGRGVGWNGRSVRTNGG